MRAFFGIPIACPPSLETVAKELEGCGADLKVVPPQNMHVTLKFLGEIPDAQGPVILEHAKKAGFPTNYKLGVKGVGAFPDWKRFNVVWAGLADPSGAISRSYTISEQLFAQIGFMPEPRPFSAHLTIARKRSDAGKDQAKRVLEPHRDETFGDLVVEGPVLFRSHLSSAGPTYERLGGVVG